MALIFLEKTTIARGGGVAIYIKDDIPVKTRFDFNSSLTIECLWITIRHKWLPRKISRVALACVYLPPSILQEDVDCFYDYFQSCYDILTAESCDTAFIIAGDFNPTCNGFKPRNLNIHCSFKRVINKATRNTSIWILFLLMLTSSTKLLKL